MQYIIGALLAVFIIGIVISLVVYLYSLLVEFLFAGVGPGLFSVTVLLCSVCAQFGYARALFRTFATSRVWYRRLAFALACGLLALTTTDLLYIGAETAPFDARFRQLVSDVTAPLVRAQGNSPWLSFAIKSAFIAPLVLLARGFASTAIEDGQQPAFRSYFYGPAWRDVATTWRDFHSNSRRVFRWIWSVMRVSVAGWHGLLTWPLSIIIGLATLAAAAVAGVQLLLTVAMHSVFLAACWLFARMCAIVILLVEKAVIRVRSRHAKCPHAACHAPVPLPVFRCPECNERHDRLIPGRCGVLVRTCKCVKGRLPTLLWLGKGRLASECPQCHKPLREELFGADVHIPIYGGPSAGKTMYMMAATWEAVSNRKSAPDVQARLMDKSDQYNRYWKPEFEAGTVREKTAAAFPDAFLLSMRRGPGTPAVLYMYDPAGEAFRDTETIAGHGFLEYSDGLAILIDPLSLSSFADRYRDELGRDVPSTTSRDPTSTVNRIVNQLQRLDWGGKPVALVLTKADVECFEDEFGVGIGALEVGADWKDVGADRSATLARWFRDNEPHLLNLLETHFSDVRFFAVSALGRDPEAGGAGRAFSPRRVMEPMAWLLSRRARFANPLRERFIGPLKELGAAAAVLGLLVLLPSFAFLKWGVPYVAGAWTAVMAYEEPDPPEAPPDPPEPGAPAEPVPGGPREPTSYEDAVAAGAPGLMAERVSVILLMVDESGFLESLGDEDVKGYLHVIPCGPPLQVSPGDREALSDDLTELGLEHLRDIGTGHVEYSDDDGHNLNFRLEVTEGQCYVLVAEGYDDDVTGPYTLRAQAGRMRYKFITYGLAGWSDWTPWDSLPQQAGATGQLTMEEEIPGAPPTDERVPPTQPVERNVPVVQPVETEAELRLAALLQRAGVGDARAQLSAALMYLEGPEGIDRNHSDAIRWLQAADTNGEPEAAVHLALVYAAGEGVPSNRDRALAWFREFLDARGEGGVPSAADPYDRLAAETEEMYLQAAHRYLRNFVVWEMEPTGVRLEHAPGTDPDATFRFAGQQARDSFLWRAHEIRNQGRLDDWSLSASARMALDRGAAAQRQRRANTTRSDMAGYLIDQMRGVMRREREAQHNNLHRRALQIIENEEQRFRSIIDNTSAYVGAIKFDATPKDAIVFIDGERYGTVDDMDDGRGRPVLAGERTIRVSREGYRTHEEIKDLRPGERYLISGSLERSGGVGRSSHQREDER